MGHENGTDKNSALVAFSEIETRGVAKGFQNSIREILRHRWAESTIRTYYHVWSGFVVFAQTMGREAFPAHPETVAAYIADLNVKGYRKSTISKVLTVIRQIHAQGQDPTTAPLVAELWRGIKRKDRRPKKRAPVVSLADLVAMCTVLEKRTSGLAIRDRALLAVGWAAAARSSELVALDWSDIKEVPEGIELTIRSSKTDQQGQGELVALPLYREDLAAACPVRALRSLLFKTEGAGQVAVFPCSGFGVTRAQLEPNTRANRIAVHRAVQRAARLAKLPGKYSSHSLRRGFATTAAASGIPDRYIMNHGRWRSRQVLDGYVERGKLWTENALSMLTK